MPVIVTSEVFPQDKHIIAKVVIPLSMLPANDAKKLSAKQQISSPAIGTILAGLALSLAAISVAFLVRGQRRARAGAATVLVIAATLGAWSVAWANTPPPHLREALQGPRAYLVSVPAEGETPQIAIEFSANADEVTLVFPSHRSPLLRVPSPPAAPAKPLE
jgi:hypothetical protein